MRKQFGLSIVELMISITLGLILMTGVMKLFLSSKAVFSTQQGLSRIQESGRLAMDFLSRDISEAAHYGCHRPIPGDDNLKLQGMPVAGTKGFHQNFDVGIFGYESASAIAASLGASPIATVPGLYANVLVVRSASQQGLILNAANTANAFTAYSTAEADTSGCISGICKEAIAIVADCTRSRVFRVSGDPERGANLVTVNHADAWSMDQIMNNFGSGAEILPFNTTVYFLAKSSSGVGSSLWQKTNDNDAFELLEGVEQLRFTYAVAATPYNYQPATAITTANNWPNVWSVRVELLVRSVEDNVLAESQPYIFAGDITPAAVTPSDRRMRQVFTATTVIRSRMPLN